MKSRTFIIASALIASLFSMPVMAQQGQGMGGPGMNPDQRGQRMNCQQAAAPEACEAQRQAMQQAREACKGKVSTERQHCMTEQHQKFDCTKSGNPQQCEFRKHAYQECKSETGPKFRQCVQTKMPPAECAKSADPKRCELNQKAREACKDKVGPDHKSCLRQQFDNK